ncbi:adenylate kinase [Lactifluus volemus]|nr:adenylate kinase [Lactifluus volemus]
MTTTVSRLFTRRSLSRRQFSTSFPSQTALPFLLHNSRSAAAPDGNSDSSHPNGRTLCMIMFGKPGAGKGTLTARLVRKYDIISISTGDLLRQHISEKTDVGLIAEKIVSKGGLLPDELMLKVVSSKLDALRHKVRALDIGWFPRTVGQGKLLDAHLRKQGSPLNLVVNLDVSDEVILARISDRWVHLPSGRVYNLSYNRPRVDGFDDETGEPLTKRPDDKPEIFARRLQQFYASTAPLLQYYSSPQASLSFGSKTRPVSIRGNTSDEIWPSLEYAVHSAIPSLRERNEERRRTSLSEVVLAREEGQRLQQPCAPSAREH